MKGNSAQTLSADPTTAAHPMCCGDLRVSAYWQLFVVLAAVAKLAVFAQVQSTPDLLMVPNQEICACCVPWCQHLPFLADWMMVAPVTPGVGMICLDRQRSSRHSVTSVHMTFVGSWILI